MQKLPVSSYHPEHGEFLYPDGRQYGTPADIRIIR